MEIKTKYHGVIQYKEEEIITFKKGLPGFDGLKKFIIFKVENNEAFSILHSVENEELGLVVVSPFYAFKDYEFAIGEHCLEELKIKSPEDVLVLCTVTLSSNPEHITTNLKGPIIININEYLGEQIILENDKYLIKHPLFKE